MGLWRGGLHRRITEYRERITPDGRCACREFSVGSGLRRAGGGPQAARRPRRRANGRSPFRRRSRRACGPHSRCLPPGFSWVIAGLRLFLPGLAARRPPAKAAKYRPLPAAAPCKPQGYGPQGRPPQAAVGGRAESPPPKNRPSDGFPAGLPRTDPPSLPHQLLPHGLQQPLFPPGDLHLRHPELPGHLGLGLAAVVPQKNQPAVPFLQICQQLVQRKQVA